MRKYFIDEKDRCFRNFFHNTSLVEFVYGAARRPKKVVCPSTEEVFLLQQQCMWERVEDNLGLIHSFIRKEGITDDGFYDRALHTLCKCSVLYNTCKGASFSHYVYRSFWNVIKRQPVQHNVSLDEHEIDVEQAQTSSITYLELRDKLAYLSDEEYNLLELRFIYDLTYDKIGRRLGFTGQTIRYRIMNALKKVEQHARS